MDGEKVPYSTVGISFDRHYDNPREFKIKGAALRLNISCEGFSQDQSRKTPPTGDDFDANIGNQLSKGKNKASDANQLDCCTICLEPISERAVAWPCNHLTFDFVCLVSWLQDHSTCPLCKAEVIEVQHDWRSPENFKTYVVTKPPVEQTPQPPNAGGSSRRHDQQRQWRRNLPTGNSRAGQVPQTSRPNDVGLQGRRQVYKHRTPSLHVGANRISQYRDFTSETFSKSAELQSRARAFLRRELQVFTFLDNDSNKSTRGNSREFLIEYILAILRTNELKGAGGEAENLVAEFLGRENGRLVLHELEAWLRSPYISLEAWDKHVQYAPKRD